MSIAKRAGQELADLLEYASESLLEMSDSSFLAFDREVRADEENAAETVRAAFRIADKQFKQRKLIAAKRNHSDSVNKIISSALGLPSSAEERRSLLNNILSWTPDYGAALTFQNRNLKNLADDDVTVALRQLESLGAIEKFRNGSS